MWNYLHGKYLQKNMNNIELFPILIKHVKHFLDMDECNSLIDIVKVQNFKEHLSLRGAARSSHFDSFRNSFLNGVDFFKTRLNELIYEYCVELSINPNSVVLSNSWINIQEPKSKLDFHVHPKSIISGVLYIKVDCNSSKLVLMNPNPHSLYSNYFISSNGNSKYNNQFYRIVPQIGDLILFPSWLSHGSGEENFSDQRIVLSFNVDLK